MFLTANEIHFLFVRENTAGTDNKKMHKAIQRKKTQKSRCSKNQFRHTKPRKRGPSDVQKKQLNEDENFSPWKILQNWDNKKNS